MPTDLPEPKKPSVAAIVVAKVADYTLGAVALGGLIAMVAYVVMLALAVMHASQPDVPPFGFTFIFAALWGSSILALFAGGLVKMATGDDD